MPGPSDAAGRRAGRERAAELLNGTGMHDVGYPIIQLLRRHLGPTTADNAASVPDVELGSTASASLADPASLCF